MKVTHAPIMPSEAATKAGRPSFTPELLAASGARYSRNNSGIEEIYSNIDFDNLDKSVDGIFKMVDYGHQSIADMAPVAMFMDNISLYLAYHLWSVCAVVGGQESSTRYIKISIDGVLKPEELGIPSERQAEWLKDIEEAFSNYQKAVDFWEDLGTTRPEVMRLPQKVLNDTSEKGLKVLERMRRNYVFDRSRYFLPMGAATNVMMVMPAREWVKLINDLLSYPLKEFNTLGQMICDELALVTPRLIKHAVASEPSIAVIQDEYEWLQANASEVYNNWANGVSKEAYLGVFLPVTGFNFDAKKDFVKALKHRTNRYSRIGSSLKRTSIRFGWNSVAMAEIRDLNRHRTGEKFCPLIPVSFYAALDQIPEGVDGSLIYELAKWGTTETNDARNALINGSHIYMYDTYLGTTFPFEHTTTANHFIYEAELRTGLGAHYRYAKHLKDVLKIWYSEFPETESLILEGEAEPE